MGKNRQASLTSNFCINEWKSLSKIMAGAGKRFSCLLLPADCLLLWWRRRVGIEPTQACSRRLTNGFEDRAIHQNRCASVFQISNLKIRFEFNFSGPEVKDPKRRDAMLSRVVHCWLSSIWPSAKEDQRVGASLFSKFTRPTVVSTTILFRSPIYSSPPQISLLQAFGICAGSYTTCPENGIELFRQSL